MRPDLPPHRLHHADTSPKIEQLVVRAHRKNPAGSNLEQDLLQPQTAASSNGETLSTTSVSDPEEFTETLTDGKPTTPTSGTAAKNPKRRHRVSTKQQINKLHDTVKELTEQLQSLESDITQSEEAANDCKALGSDGLVFRGQLWKQISARQLERRQEAERDNAKLPSMLDMQVQEANNLKRILKRRTKIKMVEVMLGVKRYKLLATEKPGYSISILQEMLQRTDEIYVGVDRQLETKSMDQVPCPGQKRYANRNVTNDVFLEIMEKQIVPFDAKMTEKTVWDALGQFGMQPLQCVKDINALVDFYAQDMQRTEDTMMISCVAATSGFKRSDVRSIRIREVLRKYVEADRAVFICRMDTKPQHASERTGIELRSTIRVIVEKADELNSDKEMTALIKSHYSISRHTSFNESYQSYADVDMAIAVWDETISRVKVDVESSLLEGKIRSRGLS